MYKNKIYKTYAEYLTETYGEKVYKLPINLPVSCPNRSGGSGGCTFCADVGTGFEAQASQLSVTEQLVRNRDYISRRYGAKKFLDAINRGHGLAEFLDAVLRCEAYQLPVCAHVILNLPNDDRRDVLETARILAALPIRFVKVHSLYIAKNTRLCEDYENGTITICEKEEYLERLALFVENLRPEMVIERLFARAPQEDVVFSNWGESWWKLQDDFMKLMAESGRCQGRCCFIQR